MTSEIFTYQQATAWVLFRRSPSLSQKQIGQRLGLSQGQISRLIAKADKKVAELKRVYLDMGGDEQTIDEAIADRLMKIEWAGQTRRRCA